MPQNASFADYKYTHQLREMAPRNKLSPGDLSKAPQIVSNYKTEQSNYGARKFLRVENTENASHAESRGESRDQSLFADTEQNISRRGLFALERKSKGEIFQ